jgi:hypothetical protein
MLVPLNLSASKRWRFFVYLLARQRSGAQSALAQLPALCWHVATSACSPARTV